jgi:hypothetical protein
MPGVTRLAQQLRQHGDVRGDAPGLVAGHQLRGRSPPRLLLEIDVGAQKRREFPKNPRRVLAWCRRCFWGSPLACDPSQRKCAPATVGESLLARTIQRRRGMGRPRRLGWCRVGVSTMTHGPAPCTGMVDEALKLPHSKSDDSLFDGARLLGRVVPRPPVTSWRHRRRLKRPAPRGSERARFSRSGGACPRERLL